MSNDVEKEKIKNPFLSDKTIILGVEKMLNEKSARELKEKEERAAKVEAVEDNPVIEQPQQKPNPLSIATKG